MGRIGQIQQFAVVFLLLVSPISFAHAQEKPEFLGKTYKLHSSENFDAFMRALDVGFLTRLAGNNAKPTVQVTEDNGVYTMKIMSTFKNQILKFKLGEEFDEETPDGRMVKSVITLDGNKMLHVSNGAKPTTVEREFTPTEMKAVAKVGNVVSTRIYKVQE